MYRTLDNDAITVGALRVRFLVEGADSDGTEVLAASAGGLPNFAAMSEVMRRHGLTPAPSR